MVSRFWRPFLSSVMVVVALVALCTVQTSAEIPYRSYIYDYYKHPRPSPQAYLPERVVTGRSLGLTDFNKPDDVFVDSNQTVYIVDTGNSRIVHTDSEFNLLRIIAEFDRDGSPDRLKNPSGVFVDQLGQICIADTGNQRIVVLDENARFLKQIDSPKPTGDSEIADSFAFIPLKLAVDHFGNLLVVVKDVYEGLMQFNPAGEFTGYTGAPRVSPSLVDVLWSRIATEEQRRRQAVYLPTEFSNIALDERVRAGNRQGFRREGSKRELLPEAPVSGQIQYHQRFGAEAESLGQGCSAQARVWTSGRRRRRTGVGRLFQVRGRHGSGIRQLQPA